MHLAKPLGSVCHAGIHKVLHSLWLSACCLGHLPLQLFIKPHIAYNTVVPTGAYVRTLLTQRVPNFVDRAAAEQLSRRKNTQDRVLSALMDSSGHVQDSSGHVQNPTSHQISHVSGLEMNLST